MAYSAGLLVYDGVDLLGLAALYQALVQAAAPGSPEGTLFSLHTVSRTKEAVTCHGGLKILPAHTFPDAHVYDAILVPGGPGWVQAAGAPRLITWIGRTARLARVVAAAGTGVFLLAATRLLDHRAVADAPGLAEAYPAVKSVKGQVVVADDPFLTSAEAAGDELARAILGRFRARD